MIRANCDVTIELDRTDRRYRPGERVTGLIRVSVDAETKCDALTLTRQWRTHGKGNRASGPEDRIQLFSGVWQPGTYTYPFDVPCPELPLSYHGQLLNVDWFLDARADVPWAIDAKASTDIFVEVGPTTVVGVDVTQAPSASFGAQAFMFLFMIPFVIVGIGLLLGGIVEDEPFMLLFGLLWSGFIGLFTWLGVKKRLARKAFTRLDTHLERVDNEHIAVVVDYGTSKLVESVTAKLVVQEVVVHGSGTDKTTYRETMHEVGELVPVGHVGQHGFRVELALPDPRVVGWSFAAPDNTLSWHVSLAFDIDSWPDLDERIELAVRPHAGPAASPYRDEYASPFGPRGS